MLSVTSEVTVVSYSFSTFQGALRFGIKFLGENKTERTIRDLDWCESQLYVIEDTIYLMETGKIIFTWDNSVQSWISKKRLNYNIQLKCEKLSSYDDRRSSDSLAFLDGIRRQKYDILTKLGINQGNLREQKFMVKKLEDHLQILRLYKKESERLIFKIEEKLEEVKVQRDRNAGVCLRLIEMKLLRKILEYFEPSSAQNGEKMSIICKYWHQVSRHEKFSKKIRNAVSFESRRAPR